MSTFTIALNPRRIQQLEAQARKDPKAYRRRVGWYLALGYGGLFGYILGTIVLGLICLALGIYIFQALIGSIFHVRGAGACLAFFGACALSLWASAAAVWRSLTKEMEMPNGMILRRAQAPKFFAMLDQLCQKVGAARIDYVLLNQEFNASVYQYSNMIGFGKSENYLIVGLPLLEALSPEQLKAIVAHEIGHIARNDSEFSSYFYGLQRTWRDLLIDAETRSSALEVVILGFLRWYVPQFTSYNFVLMRLDEYRADQFSSQLTSKRHLADGLIQIRVLAHAWQQAVQTVLKQANHQPQVPFDVFSQILAALRQPLPKSLQQKLLDQALSRKTDLDDSHPCLNDRLSALGFNRDQIQIPVYSEVSAAQQFLGPLWPKLKAQSDQIWADSFSDIWQQQYKHFQQINARLESLAAEARTSLSDALTYARKTAEWLGAEEAIPAYLALLDRDPNHLDAHQEVAVLMMNEGDERGVEHLEAVMRLDPSQTKSICTTLKAYFLAQGNIEMAKQYNDRLQSHYRRSAIA
jgi:Zn-dependent protease with chaperone function